MISFNVISRKDYDFNELMDVAKLIAQMYKPQEFLFEYTTGLKNEKNSENTAYLEKRFNSFEDFEAFLEANDIRFDSLSLIPNEDSEKISFSQSRNGSGIYGIQNSTEFMDKIINLVGAKVLYAYAHNRTDITLSRVNKYRSWKRKLGQVPDYVECYENPRCLGGEQQFLVDLESVPTHQHLVRKGDRLWFGAFAIMYFSDLYYDYIPKEKWDDFTDCVDNRVQENGLRKIVLYEELADFKNDENREKLWEFRNQLGVDEVAHQLVLVDSIPEVKFTPSEIEGLKTITWERIREAIDALQIASGQTYGKRELKEIVTLLETNKMLNVKMRDGSKVIRSRHDLQILINSYDAQLVISEII